MRYLTLEGHGTDYVTKLSYLKNKNFAHKIENRVGEQVMSAFLYCSYKMTKVAFYPRRQKVFKMRGSAFLEENSPAAPEEQAVANSLWQPPATCTDVTLSSCDSVGTKFRSKNYSQVN